MSDHTPEPAHEASAAGAAQDFRSQVQRLVAEGKLTAEEAAGLLEGTEEGAEGLHLRTVSDADPAGDVPPHLNLEVSGYSLQVVLDPHLERPQLQASQDGKLLLEASADGWRVARRPDQQLIGWSNLKAMLLVPFTPVDVKVTLGGGALNIPDIHGDMKVRVGGGALHMGAAAALNANIGGGSLKAGVIHGATHLTIGGGSALLGSHGPLSATVAGGSLNCQATLHTGEHSLTVAGGSARLELQPGSSVQLHAQATAGNVKTNFPVSRSGQFATHTYTGTLGGGQAHLKVRVAGGNVVIEA